MSAAPDSEGGDTGRGEPGYGFRRYLAAGLSVLPLQRRSKLPDDSLLPTTTKRDGSYGHTTLPFLYERRPTPQELTSWEQAGAGVALVCGEISDNFCTIDCDDPDFAVWMMTSPTAELLTRHT